MLNILLSGCNGRMGRAITELCQQRTDIKIVAGLDIVTVPRYDFPVYANPHEIEEDIDGIIDFSNPKTLSGLLSFATEKKIPLVLSTTGFSEHQITEIEAASKMIPLFRSGNMSLGINLLILLAKTATRVLDGFDIEIIEKHHNQKLDAPSGTALMIYEGIKSTMKNTPNLVYDRHDVSKKREPNEIGMHTVRGGTIVGEHEVIYAGTNEVIEIKHTAQSREVFAVGAVEAMIYLAGQKEPGLYNMDHLLAERVF